MALHFHTDIAVLKMTSDSSSFVRVAMGRKSEVLIIIELKMVVATELQNVRMKDIMELQQEMVKVQELFLRGIVTSYT